MVSVSSSQFLSSVSVSQKRKLVDSIPVSQYLNFVNNIIYLLLLLWVCVSMCVLEWPCGCVLLFLYSYVSKQLLSIVCQCHKTSMMFTLYLLFFWFFMFTYMFSFKYLFFFCRLIGFLFFPSRLPRFELTRFNPCAHELNDMNSKRVNVFVMSNHIDKQIIGSHKELNRVSSKALFNELHHSRNTSHSVFFSCWKIEIKPSILSSKHLNEIAYPFRGFVCL